MRARFLIVLALLLPDWNSHGAQYVGPCDLLTCAEAYSVTRSMTRNYSGALFQLYNGSTTLDIGQTVDHVVDMSTWSAFCSGLASNCKYGKFYAQIQVGNNDLGPSTVSAPYGPDCSAGGYACAAPFMIESATGLPIISTVAPQEYAIGGTDVLATGITGAGANVSVVYNGKAIQTTFCCAAFGLSHKYSAADVAGTNFIIYAVYGTSTVAPSGICSTSTNYCTGVGFEESGVAGDYVAASPINLITMATYNSGTNTVTTAYNGHSLYNGAPSPTINTKTYIHLGGGGDFSQPAPVLMREGLIVNGDISAQETQILTNMTAFYGTLSFP